MLKSGLIRGPMASFIFFARFTAARFIAPDFYPCSSNRNGSWCCSKQLANCHFHFVSPQNFCTIWLSIHAS